MSVGEGVCCFLRSVMRSSALVPAIAFRQSTRARSLDVRSAG